MNINNPYWTPAHVAGPKTDAPQATGIEPPAVRSVADHPDLRRVMEATDVASYPPYLRHAHVAAYWDAVYTCFPEWQLALLDAASGSHLAHGNAVPFAWDGTAADLPRTAVELVCRALRDRRHGTTPTALGALQAVVDPALRRRGLSARMLTAMAAHAEHRGYRHLLAPIRPIDKHRHPLTPFERYVRWARPDGLPHDPWQRLHRRLGATPVVVVPNWLTVTGTVAEWSAWTGMAFPESGWYIVPGALTPVAIDHMRGLGRYAEPHLWMHYRLDPGERRSDEPVAATAV
jgi:GNAT superfamily N-acetyltransferase